MAFSIIPIMLASVGIPAMDTCSSLGPIQVCKIGSFRRVTAVTLIIRHCAFPWITTGSMGCPAHSNSFQPSFSGEQSAGITPEVVRTGRVESIISGVAVGEGISLLAKSNFRIFQAGQVKVVPLDPPRKLFVVFAKLAGTAQTDAMRIFADYMCKGCEV
ncbi:hypothetical protein ANACAC_02500 [Anaerostipes caccae L1-92]|uniref:LysR substrate-binding domain-containing protein n=2 Tax=Anaerostipes caccae TaxID=105841 RepID=B0MFG4_ANACD|nr:hypothetical protein [Anaerostipes caccae]EDR97270.1 hypothetical protein ANACAC_02500 [Anaerostipes caccae L1-92]